MYPTIGMLLQNIQTRKLDRRDLKPASGPKLPNKSFGSFGPSWRDAGSASILCVLRFHIHAAYFALPISGSRCYSFTVAKPLRNPFEFGGELAPGQLVDRQDELKTVIRTVENGGKLFLIGPRRYGKTSILAAAQHRLEQHKAVIIRHDAETYESLQLLAEGILAEAARKLTGSLEKAGETVKKIFSHLRPDVNYNFAEQKISVSLGMSRDAPQELPLLTDVLNTVDRLAAAQQHPVAVVIDEFQQVIAQGGATAERQIRSVVQRHHHTAYVFAGSKTRLLADMTNDPARAFWKLGTRYFIGPIPRPEFLEFLQDGFTDSGFHADAGVLVQILDLAEEDRKSVV